jgi:hypothetical protein
MKKIHDYLDFVKSKELKSILRFFLASVPDKPYCCDFDHYLKVLPKDKALAFPKLQPNFPHSVSALTLDVDHNHWMDLYHDKYLPPPNLITFDPIKGTAHIQYHLIQKVYTNNPELRKAVNFLATIEYTLNLAWEADKAYSGLITKNPFHLSNSNMYARLEPYTLSELEESLPELQTKPPRKELMSFGVGRNVSTFEYLRFIGYNYFTSHARHFLPENCQQYLLPIGIDYGLQNYHAPLEVKEVNQICKNISNWILKKYDYATFCDIQKERNKKSIAVRHQKSEKLFFGIKDTIADNPTMSNRAMAKMLGISEGTVRNAKKYFDNVKNTSPLFDNSDGMW